MALRRHQVCVKKLNVNEPLKTCRKNLDVDKTVGGIGLAGLLQPLTAYGLQISRHRDGRIFTQALIRNVRGFPVDVPTCFAGVFFLTTVRQKTYSRLQLNHASGVRSNRERRTKP